MVKIKVKVKKFSSLFLFFSLVMLSTNIAAKERKGAELIVEKTDGQQIKGELIAVKQHSLLLLDFEGADVSLDMGEIRLVEIVKKSKSLVWGGIGLVSGAVIGALIGYSQGDDPPIMRTGPPLRTDDEKALALGIICGIAGGVFGSIGGAIEGKDRIIQIEGKSDAEVKEMLQELGKKARVRNFQ